MVSEPVFWNPNLFWLPLIQAIIHSGQVSPAISLSGHLSFRPSVPVLRAKGENLILSSFPVSSIPGNDFPVGRIVVRKHSPPTTFPANFSGDVFFPHRKERLQETSNFSQSIGARKPPTRRPRAFFRPATTSHALAREPLSGDALPPPASLDAD